MTIIQQMCPAHQVLPHPWPWSAIVSTYSPIDFEHWHHCTVLFITIASTRDRQICYGHYICGHIYSNRTETKLLSYEMLRSYKPLKVLPAMDSTFNQSNPCTIQPSIAWWIQPLIVLTLDPLVKAHLDCQSIMKMIFGHGSKRQLLCPYITNTSLIVP